LDNFIGVTCNVTTRLKLSDGRERIMSDDFDPFELIPRKRPQSAPEQQSGGQQSSAQQDSSTAKSRAPQHPQQPPTAQQGNVRPLSQRDDGWEYDIDGEADAPPNQNVSPYAPPGRYSADAGRYLAEEVDAVQDMGATHTMDEVITPRPRYEGRQVPLHPPKPGATSPAAGRASTPDANQRSGQQPVYGAAQAYAPAQPAPRRANSSRRGGGFWRGLGTGLLTFVVLMAFGLGIALIGYAVIAGGDALPPISEFRNNLSSFQTTRFYDREGNLLNATFDLNEGLRTQVPLEEISPWLRQATIATEDANFYRHEGVDPVALARALYYAVIERDIVSGASTIPQQLVKMLLLTPEVTLTRKVKEAILASEISRIYDKDDILEIYLNEINYGNLSYGAAAAAETYFNKSVGELTLAEASLLAGLPQLPATYDPYSHPDRAKRRQSVVLGLMVEQGYISAEEADAAYQEPLVYHPLVFNLEAPHFTLYVRQQVEQALGSDALYKAGLNVETTLDPRLQSEAERIVAENVAKMVANNGSNGALVAMNPTTGEVLALVGSADFNNVEIDGQVNMALAPRQPGSSMKPLVYLANFENPAVPASERWTPGTLIADIREAFPDGANPPYVPVNYDGREHGLLTVRSSLANSYNIPAVRALQNVGLPAFLELAQRLGITTLTRPDYGLGLSLGAGEIPLIEATGAFATLANGGMRQPPITIRRITDNAGTVLCEMGTDNPCQGSSSAREQVVSAVDAFLVTDILSDNEARSVAFGPNSVLNLGRPAAVKTGTTNDIRDILTIGYTPQLVTGVWVGNADNSPMVNVSGVSGAGPIWNEFMTSALATEPVVNFVPPAGVKQFEVCKDTGTLPSSACPEKAIQWFAEDRPPLSAEHDLWQTVRYDRNTGQPATEFTPADQIEERNFKVYPEAWRAWAQENGIEQPPFLPQPLPTGDTNILPPAPTVDLAILSPTEGETVGGLITVYGTVEIPNLLSYELQYGESHDPGAFSLPVAGPYGGVVRQSALGQWNTSGLAAGPYTLRLLARDANGAQYEARVRLWLMEATPTPEPPTPIWVDPTATWTPIFGEPIPVNTQTPVYFPPVEQPTSTPVAQPPEVNTETPVYFPPVEGDATATPAEEPRQPEPTVTWTPLPLEGGDGG
jgi:penicillin-binding protein 1C